MILVEAGYSKDNEEAAIYTYKFLNPGSEIVLKSEAIMDYIVGKEYNINIGNEGWTD